MHVSWDIFNSVHHQAKKIQFIFLRTHYGYIGSTEYCLFDYCAGWYPRFCLKLFQSPLHILSFLRPITKALKPKIVYYFGNVFIFLDHRTLLAYCCLGLKLYLRVLLMYNNLALNTITFATFHIPITKI